MNNVNNIKGGLKRGQMNVWYAPAGFNRGNVISYWKGRMTGTYHLDKYDLSKVENSIKVGQK